MYSQTLTERSEMVQRFIDLLIHRDPLQRELNIKRAEAWLIEMEAMQVEQGIYQIPLGHRFKADLTFKPKN